MNPMMKAPKWTPAQRRLHRQIERANVRLNEMIALRERRPPFGPTMLIAVINPETVLPMVEHLNRN
jgi:hypothetical protein